MRLPRCEADGASEYWGGCEAPARYRIERAGDSSYGVAEACPAHVGDLLAAMADGDDVPLTVRVHFDDPAEPELAGPAVDDRP